MSVRTWHSGGRQNITIEIASRQSGKTQRIIDSAISDIHSSDNTNVIVVCSTTQQQRLFRGRFNSRLDDMGLTNRRRYRNKLVVINGGTLGSEGFMSLHSFVEHPENRLYFDEFEHMDFDCRLPVFKNAHYTATPTRGFRDSNTFRIMSSVSPDLDATDLDFGNFFLRVSDEERGEQTFRQEYFNAHAETVEINQRERALTGGPWTIEQGDMEVAWGEGIGEEMRSALGADEPEMNEVDAYLDRLGI